jgi:hypothetical protein
MFSVGARGFQCALFCFLGARLCAAEITLRGRVVDEASAPVPGAVISLRPVGEPSPSSPAIQSTADPTGVFRAILPQPGNYLLTVSQPDFFRLVDRPVDILEGANEIVLSLNHIRNTSESIDVRSSPSPIDIDQTDSERRLSGKEIFDIPYPSTHDLRNAMPLMPGVLQGPQGELHFDGGAENQVQYLLGGFNISDPLTGTFSTHLSVDGVRSMDFLSGRYSPEYGKGSSGVLAIHTETGDDTFRYSATNFVPGIDTNGGVHVGAYTPRLNFSGPIVKGRAWFSDNVDASYNKLYVPDLPAGQNIRTSYGGSNLLHTQINLTPSSIIFTDFLVNVSVTPNSGLGALDPIATTIDQRSREWFFSAKDQVYLTRGMLLEFGVSDLRSFVREVPQGQALYIFTPNGRRGNFYIDSTQTSQRKQLLANLFLPSFHWMGSHQFKTGVDLDRLSYSQDTRRTGFENVGLTGNILRQVTFAGSGVLARPSLELSSYIVDNWKIKPNLVVEMGLRQDWNELVRDTVLSPRVSFSYAPFGSKNTKVSGGYAVLYDSVTPQLFSRPADQYSLTTLYNADGSVHSGPGATVFTVGRSGLEMPYYRNWSLGLEQMLPRRIFLRVNLLRRRGDHGFTYVNVLRPQVAPAPDMVTMFHTTQFDSIYRLENQRRDVYDSAEIALHQSFGKGYEWMASYTRSRAFSNAVTDVTVDQPTLITDNVGRLPWDSPNRILTWGYFPTPFKNWAIAYLFETRTGFPFSVQDEIGRVLGAPDPDRFPNYLNLNLHLEWTTHLFGYRFALRGGLNNLTDHRNYTVVNNTFGSPNFLTFYGSTTRHFVVRLRWLGRLKS